MYNEFQQWAIKYAKLFTVVSGAIVLLSWLIENLLVAKLNQLKDELKDIQNEKTYTQRQNHLESKLLEIYQVSTSARDYALLAVDEDKIDAEDRLTRIVDRLERIGVTRDFIISFIMYSSKQHDIIDIVNPPDTLAARVKNSVRELNTIAFELEEIKKDYETKQKAITGSETMIYPDALNDESLNQLHAIVETSRMRVDREIGPRSTRAANEMFRASDELFAFAKGKVKQAERVHRTARIFQVILFIVGSVFAIYGTYLESINPKK